VVLAAGAVLLGNDHGEQPQLGQCLQADAGVLAGAVGIDRVGADHVVADLDQPLLELQLLGGQEPQGVELVVEAVIRFAAPALGRSLVDHATTLYAGGRCGYRIRAPTVGCVLTLG